MCIKYSLPVKNTHILVLGLDKTAISAKTNYFGSFFLFSLECMDILHYPSKDSSRKEISKHFKQLPTPNTTFGDSQKQRVEIKMVLFNLLQQHISVELHII